MWYKGVEFVRDATLARVAIDAATKPLLEVVPILPGYLFRSGLMKVIIPMLPTCIGLMARIKAFVLGPAPVASRRRVTSPTPCV
jgi:hypothetical protein